MKFNILHYMRKSRLIIVKDEKSQLIHIQQHNIIDHDVQHHVL